MASTRELPASDAMRILLSSEGDDSQEEKEQASKDHAKLLEGWIEKWSFILNNSLDLSDVGAYAGLRELDDIVSDAFEESHVEKKQTKKA